MAQTDPQNTDPKKMEETLEEITHETPVDTVEPTSDDEIVRLRESLARSQADYQNLLMRVERDKIEMVSFLSAKLVMPLLKEVDNLERAVALKS
jgi:molecular chaperone GrpE (heat shock protein)